MREPLHGEAAAILACKDQAQPVPGRKAVRRRQDRDREFRRLVRYQRLGAVMRVIGEMRCAACRIERAVAASRQANQALAKRHATLKARMAEALKALDEVIAREGGA